MSCTNNLKQIGIAFHNYIDGTGGYMPAQGYRRGAGGSPPVSFFSSLLPYMEATAVYDSIYGNASTIADGDSQSPAGTPPWQAPCVAAYRAEIPGFKCPSDGNNRRPTPLAPGRTNYRVCLGDWSPAAGSTAGGDDFRGVVSGLVGTGLQSARWVKASIITDGTSNTILGSERNCGGSMPNNLKSGIHVVAGVFTSSAHIENPQICLTTDKDGSNGILNGIEDTTPTPGATANDGFPNNTGGYSWLDGATMFIGFTTILPPNAPACAATASATQNSRVLVPATSSHSGGVGVVMCDGAVKFVSDTIDVGSELNQPPGVGTAAPVAGSRYGVWGASGTPSGKESKSL